MCDAAGRTSADIRTRDTHHRHANCNNGHKKIMRIAEKNRKRNHLRFRAKEPGPQQVPQLRGLTSAQQLHRPGPQRQRTAPQSIHTKYTSNVTQAETKSKGCARRTTSQRTSLALVADPFTRRSAAVTRFCSSIMMAKSMLYNSR